MPRQYESKDVAWKNETGGLILKHLLPASLRVLGLRLATLCVAAAVTQAAQATELTFEKAFNTKGEPRALHYQAQFSAKGSEHQLEVWRDGDKRLKRSTDKAIETYVFRQHGSTEFQMSILDMKKKICTRVGRTNFYRIGHLIDWFDLAHGLKHPVGAYRIAKAKVPDGVPKAVMDCQWYDLNQNNRTTHICWSPRNRLPVVIQSESGKVVWKLTSVDMKPIPAKTFEIHDEGFVRNNANEDIEGD
jgi:hypothetical protein